jgi:hypothetical protein
MRALYKYRASQPKLTEDSLRNRIHAGSRLLADRKILSSIFTGRFDNGDQATFRRRRFATRRRVRKADVANRARQGIITQPWTGDACAATFQ